MNSMALRDQPYIPLYIKDIMTDEKLNECSAATHGVYLKGILCLMHKSESYGKILLKQNHKQSKNISLNFANQLFRHLPYTVEEIKEAIDELINEKVCYYDGDYLCQKRMIKDGQISSIRSKAGKKGGGNPNFVKTNEYTNAQTNSEYVNVIENAYVNVFNKEDEKFKTFLCEKFSVSEINQPRNYINICRAIIFKKKQSEEKNRWFRDQCYFYFKYKEAAKEKIHSLSGFLGSYEDDLDTGGWNNQNWQKKFKSEVKNDSKERSHIYPGTFTVAKKIKNKT